VKRALEGEDLVRSGWLLVEEVLARHLDGKLAAFGAGVGEEHRVGEGVFDQLVGQRLLLGIRVEVRGVPEPVGLIGERLDKRRVAWPRAMTAMPEPKSRKRRPSASTSHAPSPLTKESFARV
jgi:hypothetical protein